MSELRCPHRDLAGRVRHRRARPPTPRSATAASGSTNGCSRWPLPAGDGRQGGEGEPTTRFAGGGQGFGAEIMGANMFGPTGGGPWGDADWKGWWGRNPPFHSPCSSSPTGRGPDRDGGRDDVPLPHRPHRAAPEQARAAAEGKDVRIGGGADVVRDFVAAGSGRSHARRSRSCWAAVCGCGTASRPWRRPRHRGRRGPDGVTHLVPSPRRAGQGDDHHDPGCLHQQRGRA